MSENNRKPTIAICYDFDRTLSPKNMQEQGFLEKIGCPNADTFWQESNEMANKNNMDKNLSYMYKMIHEARGKSLFTKNTLKDLGKDIEFFPGVNKWFKRINKYGESKGVLIEHYIISSGLKEIIEGTKIAQYFDKIYACSFLYDDQNVPIWPAQVINYTNKTQFLFRISKGILDINDDKVNDYIPEDKLHIPFRNIVYIGDSDTDIPCMKLVNVNGGHSIGVYDPNTNDKTKVFKMMRENRIRYYAPADYSKDKELDKLIKLIIDRTATNEKLQNTYYSCMNEEEINYKSDKLGYNETIKNKYIDDLRKSLTFQMTHEIIDKLNSYDTWTIEQINDLFEILHNNSQVYRIIQDRDVKEFYNMLKEKINFLYKNIENYNN